MPSLSRLLAVLPPARRVIHAQIALKYAAQCFFLWQFPCSKCLGAVCIKRVLLSCIDSRFDLHAARSSTTSVSSRPDALQRNPAECLLWIGAKGGAGLWAMGCFAGALGQWGRSRCWTVSMEAWQEQGWLHRSFGVGPLKMRLICFLLSIAFRPLSASFMLLGGGIIALDSACCYCPSPLLRLASLQLLSCHTLCVQPFGGTGCEDLIQESFEKESWSA